MSEFSNLLRQRLLSRATPWVQADSHPDADTLTAYVERSLRVGDRNRVLGHLAGCGQCREVVALSLAEQSEAIAPPVAASAIPWWRQRWAPRLGLAASLATVAVIAAVVVELPWKSHTAPQGSNAKFENRGAVPDASISSPAPADAQASGASQPPAAVAGGAGSLPSNETGSVAGNRARLRDDAAGNDRLASAARASTNAKDLAPVRSPAQPVVVTGGVYAVEASSRRQDYLNSQFFNADGAVAVNGSQVPEVPSAPPAKAPNAFQLQNSLGNSSQFPTAFSNLPAPAQQNTKVLVIKKPPSHSHFPMIVLDQIPLAFRRATPAIRPKVANDFAMRGAELNPLKEKDMTELSAAAPAADAYRGDLDRSAAFTPNAMSDKYEKKTETSVASWKVDGGKLWKSADSGAWMEAYPDSEGVDFSVVKPHGSDIWAGGNNAALLHSRDGGGSWERVTLGASATGTITSIEARGANVLVRSSSGQSWSSQDGGKSWTLLD